MKNSTILPRPTVTVTPTKERDPDAPGEAVDVVISRSNGVRTDGTTRSPPTRSYVADGGGIAEVVKDAVEKILNDPFTAEFIP